MNSKPIRVLVADDHQVVRQGVETLLASDPEIEVCATVATGRDAVREAEQKNPDVVVLDLSMPDLNGMDATRQILKAAPGTSVLIFSMHETEQLVQEVFQAGARAYVLKSDATEKLLEAVKAVHAGSHFFSSKVTEVIFEKFLRSVGESKADAAGRLSSREREIVQLLSEGKSNKETAAILGISIKTVETHRGTIMRKLHLQSFSDLVRYAIRENIIQP